MSDLIERLRGYDWRGKERTRTAHEAAGLIEALQAENARMREAINDALKCTPYCYRGGEVSYDGGNPFHILSAAITSD